MSRKLRIILIITGIFLIYMWFIYSPVILASFDDDRYVEGEVFLPDDDAYDFRKFTLNCSNSTNFTAEIYISGFAQLIDYECCTTINVLEWDKMTGANRDVENSTLMDELEKPSRTVNGTRIIDVDIFSAKLYASYAFDSATNTAVYLASPSEAKTVEMIQSLEFKK